MFSEVGSTAGALAQGRSRGASLEAGWLRRRRLVRAFEDKRGGWTLVTGDWKSMRIESPVGVLIWEALKEWTTLDGVTSLLRLHFQGVDPGVIREDAAAFLAELLRLGFIELEVAPA